MKQIDFKLALELKNAGFPFVPLSQEDANSSVGRDLVYQNKAVYFGSALYHIPTLSELIEECGEEGFALFGPNRNIGPSLEKTEVGIVEHKGGKITEWVALIREDEIVCRGKTALIAVAKLWLKLHEGSSGKTA